MFNNLKSAFRDLTLSLTLLRTELFELRKDFHKDYKYYVELQTKESRIHSNSLSSLKEVNEYINGMLFLGGISSINILKVFDDGR